MGSWQLVTDLTSRGPRFCPRAVHMRFVVGKNGTGTDSLRTQFFAISYHSKAPCSSIIWGSGQWAH